MACLGFLVVATNKYIDFVSPLVESMYEHLDAGFQLRVFVFTDSKTVPDGTIRVEQEHRPWPLPTLLRYRMFSQHERLFSACDYLFYCDADMRFVGSVDDIILGERVAVLHPGYYNKPRTAFTYEKRPQSRAYVRPDEGEHYYCGGFQGGTTEEYLKMAATISQWVDEDFENNLIAVWHDESHYNRYLIDNQPTHILSPSYCYPESWNLPFEKKLLALDKNHKEMRG